MSSLNVMPTLRDIAKMLEHALLHPTLTDTQFESGCALAVHYDVAAVCVKPCDVPRAAQLVSGSDVKVCSVIGFPHGNSHTSIKVLETELAIREGAVEIDMVAKAGKILGGSDAAVSNDIRLVNAACLAHGAILKVIFENDYLEDAHIIRLCQICSEIGVAFVKTSTGFGFVKQQSGDYNYKGATEPQLRLMRAHCPPSVQIKAAGGIRTLDELLSARSIGVTRVGTSATQALLEEAVKRGFTGAEELSQRALPGYAPNSAGY